MISTSHEGAGVGNVILLIEINISEGKAIFFILLFFFFFFSHAHSMQNFLSQGSNLCHSCNQTHSSRHQILNPLSLYFKKNFQRLT